MPGQVAGPDSFPDLPATVEIRRREEHHVSQPPGERRVHVVDEIGRQQDEAFVPFDALEEVRRFDVRVAVVRVLDGGPFAEESVGFVEEKNCVAVVGGLKELLEVFLVSPMYLETMEEQSTRKRGSSSRAARTSAARVLPVPGGPAKRAFVPLPWPSFRPKPHSFKTRSRNCTRLTRSSSWRTTSLGTIRSSHRAWGSIRSARLPRASTALFAASQIAAGEPSPGAAARAAARIGPCPSRKVAASFCSARSPKSTAQAAGGEGIAPGVRADIDRRRGQLDHHESTAPWHCGECFAHFRLRAEVSRMITVCLGSLRSVCPSSANAENAPPRPERASGLPPSPELLSPCGSPRAQLVGGSA